MTKDMSTILFCANILTEARYVGTSRFRVGFSLLLIYTTKQQSHGK